MTSFYTGPGKPRPQAECWDDVRWGTGYKSYNNTTSWASIVHEFVSHDPSSAHPGRWYFFAKSNKLQRQSFGAYWFYGGDSSLPATPAGSGWSASG